MKAKKILIGPVEIAGFYANLARGLSDIGVTYDYITYAPHPFGYGGETKRPISLRLAKFFNGFRGKPGRPFITRAIIALPGQALQIFWGISAIFKYDIFIFGFGYSLLPRNFDLIILKLMGKIVIANLSHGSEARPPYIDGSYQSKDGSVKPTTDQLISLSKFQKKKIALIEEYADVVLGSHFSTTHFSSRKLVNWLAIGLPMVPQKASDAIAGRNTSAFYNDSCPRVRILHSPSHPAVKGTSLIVRAISNLKDKGYEIDLVLLKNKPNSEVIREIQCSDFVVDQLYSDHPMAGFATEAAWFGKPAVVGGYGFNTFKKLVPADMWPPSMTCHPDGIEDAIEDLIVNREKRLQLGVEAQRFVHEKWSAVAVARRFLRLIEGDIPEEWWLDPCTVTYLEGVGQTVECSQSNIRQMVARSGVDSLQLSHRPELERAFLDFAGVKGFN